METKKNWDQSQRSAPKEEMSRLVSSASPVDGLHPRASTAIEQSASDQYAEIGKNIVRNVVNIQKDSLPSSSDLAFRTNAQKGVEISKPIVPLPNVQEFPQSHEVIPEMVESPKEGDILNGSSIMTEEVASQKEKSVISDVKSQKIVIGPGNEVKFEHFKSQKSSQMAKRPRANKSNKPVNRSLAKMSHNISNDFSSINMYNTRKGADSRKYSLPDIKRHFPRKAPSNKSYKSSKKSKNKLNSSSISNGKAKNGGKQEIGQSFMSFNANNSSNRNQHVSAHYKQSFGNPALQASNVRESFDSQTTEGKNEVEEDEVQKEQSSIHNEAHQEYNDDGSQASIPNTATIGENSLPDIDNSVVDETLPFRGLDNHYNMISKEGYSGANNTHQMQKTNENFYSSFKSKVANSNPIQYKESSYNHLSSFGNDPSENNGYDSSDIEREIGNRESTKQGNMYNIMRSSKNAQNSRSNAQRNSKFRSKYSRSKNSSSEVKNSMKADLKNGLPKISNTGKIVSRKMAEIGNDMSKRSKGSKYYDQDRGHLSYDDVYDNIRGFKRNRQSSEKSHAESSLDRNSGIINYRMATGISQPNRKMKYPKQSDVIAPWKINKKNRVLQKDAENYADRRSYNASSSKNSKYDVEVKVAIASKGNNLKIPKVSNK